MKQTEHCPLMKQGLYPLIYTSTSPSYVIYSDPTVGYFVVPDRQEADAKSSTIYMIVGIPPIYLILIVFGILDHVELVAPSQYSVSKQLVQVRRLDITLRLNIALIITLLARVQLYTLPTNIFQLQSKIQLNSFIQQVSIYITINTITNTSQVFSYIKP